MTGTKGPPREFFLTWIHTFKDGEFAAPAEVTHLIVDNPNADMLENNGVHVVEKQAYDAVTKERDELLAENVDRKQGYELLANKFEVLLTSQRNTATELDLYRSVATNQDALRKTIDSLTSQRDQAMQWAQDLADFLKGCQICKTVQILKDFAEWKEGK